MEQYQELIRHILKNGSKRSDRTGVGTISCFGYQMRFDLQKGFPLVTTKKTHVKSVIHELLWFVKGDTNIRYLVRNGVNIWNEWPFRKYLNDKELQIEPHSDEWKAEMKKFINLVKEDFEFAQQYGELGPVYGKQWRDFNGVDQLMQVVKSIKKNPNSRRLIVNSWNAAEIDEMAKAGLPPCHTMFQFYVHDGKLSCQLYQRSADTFLGVPFNIASYALLTMMVAQVTGLEPGEFVHTFGDVHLYSNHLEQAEELLTRKPKPLPKIKLNPEIKNIFAFEYDDFQLVGYDPWPAIKAKVAV